MPKMMLLYFFFGKCFTELLVSPSVFHVIYLTTQNEQEIDMIAQNEQSGLPDVSMENRPTFINIERET